MSLNYVVSDALSVLQGFDEYMNLVLDEGEEVHLKTKTRKTLGESLVHLNDFDHYLDVPTFHRSYPHLKPLRFTFFFYSFFIFIINLCKSARCTRADI